MASYVPFNPLFNNVASVRQRIATYSSQRTAQYLKLVEDDSAENTHSRTLFGSLVKRKESGSRAGSSTKLDMELSEQDLTAEAQSYITAGTDTTAVTLVYLVYAVCRHPEVQKNLVRQLHALPVSEDGDVTDRALRDLPYLNWVIDETLRLYGAAQGGLPRIVPQKGTVLLGRYLPGGVQVSTQSYTVHRDRQVFTDPHR
jgi:cytochrome P450